MRRRPPRLHEKYTVTFFPGRDGRPIALIAGWVVVPGREWGDRPPRAGEEWEVEVTGENPRGTVFFLKAVTSPEKARAIERLVDIVGEQIAGELVRRGADPNAEYARLAREARVEYEAATGLPWAEAVRILGEDQAVRSWYRSRAQLGTIREIAEILGGFPKFWNEAISLHSSSGEAKEVARQRRWARDQMANIEALVRAQDIPVLIRMLETDDAQVRIAAAGALEKIGDPAVPALAHMMEKEHSEEVRREAAMALKRIGTPLALLYHSIKLVTDGNWQEAEAALKVLPHIAAGPVPEELLQELLDAFPVAYPVRAGYIAQALSILRDERAVPRLEELLLDESTPYPDLVARTLAEIAGIKAIPTLSACASRWAGELWLIKALALAASDRPQYALSLILPHADILFDKSNSQPAFYSVTEIISKLVTPGCVDAIPVLRRALSHKSESVRWFAVIGLGKIGTDAVVPDLLGALDDKEQMVADAAMQALAAMGREIPAVIPPLVSALVRKMRGKTLRECVEAVQISVRAGAGIVPYLALVAQSDCDDYQVRWGAVWALQKMGVETNYPWMKKRPRVRLLTSIWGREGEPFIVREIVSEKEARVYWGEKEIVVNTELVRVVEPDLVDEFSRCTRFGTLANETELLRLLEEYSDEEIYATIRYLTSNYDNSVIPFVLRHKPGVFRMLEDDKSRLLARARATEHPLSYILAHADECPTVRHLAGLVYITAREEDRDIVMSLPDEVLEEVKNLVAYHKEFDDLPTPAWEFFEEEDEE